MKADKKSFPFLKVLLLFAFAILISSSCKKNDHSVSCDDRVVISKQLYENAPDGALIITELRVEGDGLSVNFQASGCSGDTWITKLIDSETLIETNPAIRTLRLSLDNKELCEAFISKQISFNIKELRIKGSNTVILDISGKSILYKY